MFYKLSALISVPGSDMVEVSMTFRANSRLEAYQAFCKAMLQLGWKSIDYVNLKVRKLREA